MVKGLFVGLMVVIVLAVIPVVHFLGIPFGPFIAGYLGINAARNHPGTPGRRAMSYGAWMAVVVAVVTAAAATIVTVVGDFAYPYLLWGGVVVAVFYYGSMSALGAWYSGLRAAERALASAAPGQAATPRAGSPTDD